MEELQRAQSSVATHLKEMICLKDMDAVRSIILNWILKWNGLCGLRLN
jgi:hypothetical protein